MTKHCPPLEEISAFINHQLSQGRRGFITEHLATCAECYQLYSQTTRTQESLAKHLLIQKVQKFINWFKPSEKKFWQYTVPLVATSAFALFYWAQSISPVPHSSTTESVQLLTVENVPSSLLKLAFEHESSSLAFSNQYALRQEAVKLGITLIDLELALAANDEESSLENLRIVTQILARFVTDRSLIETIEIAARQIEEENDFKKLPGISSQIELTLKNRPENDFLEFGKWLESGRLAALTNNLNFFEKQDGVYFQNHFDRQSMPPRVLEILNQVASLKTAGKTGDHEFQRLALLFAEMQELIVR